MKEFNSQICTSREQSERLLALGLKKETADCCYIWRWESDSHFLYANSWEDIHISKNDIPAWSLHRLIEIMDVTFQTSGRYVLLEEVFFVRSENFYDNVIDCIEWLIKEGYFNKEYLENQAEVDEHCKGVLEYLDYIREDE